MTPALLFPMVAPVPAQVLTLRPRLPAVAAPDLHRRPAPLSQPRPQKNLAPGSTSRHPRSTSHPYISRRSAFASSVPPWHLQFVCPLFSYSYELLFPQVFYFDNDPHCPGVWGTSGFLSNFEPPTSNLEQPPFARFPRPAYTSKARRQTPCSACKHFAPKCVRPCASL